ncbi:MAG TPA: DeoR family transcriptional regulator [Candidatus Hydrogenedentes bacterium]|nr:DeoR family transcriptional regulator [Candidatus Hydrogenedentota bacterium]
MDEIALHGVHTYTDVDRRFWHEHLEEWAPRRIFDAHVHVVNPRYRVDTVSEEMRRSHWAAELSDGQEAETAERAYRTVFPQREVCCLAFGLPNLGWDLIGANESLRAEAAERGWYTLAVVRPAWVAEQVEAILDQPGVIGVKPYYACIEYDRADWDKHLESSIFSFLPHHQLEVLDSRRAWVTLHVPRAERLGHPDNIREIREIRRRYPHVRLVVAHLGRCYTLPHAKEGLRPLTDDPEIYFDNSAVLNPDVHEFALRTIGYTRILYGTDNPVCYLRGRRQWHGRHYVNRTSHPFHFNTERESPEIEAQYTLYMYEALRALKEACRRLGLGEDAVRALLHDNARRLVGQITEEEPSQSREVARLSTERSHGPRTSGLVPVSVRLPDWRQRIRMKDGPQKERRETIRHLLAQQGSLRVRDLVHRLGVTSMTVRRDLASLEQEGVVLRTHGGCVIQSPMVPELSFTEKDALRGKQKAAVARAAVKHVRAACSIFIDTGTTALHFARALSDDMGLRVFTNNLRVAMELFSRDAFEVIVYGGVLAKRSPDLAGELSLTRIREFRLDLAILGADAIDTTRGHVYAADIPTAQLDALVAEQASKVMILADSSKLDKHSLALVTTLGPGITLVTDNEASRSSLARLRRTGADIVIAEYEHDDRS